jgi:hypothetical protein
MVVPLAFQQILLKALSGDCVVTKSPLGGIHEGTHHDIHPCMGCAME